MRHLYDRPAPLLRRQLSGISYHWIALGCADGLKESLLGGKIPTPASFHAADTNLTLARLAALRQKTPITSWGRIDLNSQRLPSSISHFPRPWLITLFGVLPNLDPLPLLSRLQRAMKPGDLLLFSANLAPSRSGLAGARKVLSQYDNLATRQWLQTAALRYRPHLPKGHLEFGVFYDPRQKSLARIEARWISGRRTKIVFSSRRPTVAQVETWIFKAGLRKVARFIEPRGEEAVWLVARPA